ncbi:MAG: histidine phosphatase family protein [Christensenellales bacterium]|jgi:probable phosphoglycerate mutase
MRHGKTDWNALRKLQGRTDVPLNDEGRLMAKKASEEYKAVHFDVCYCSPLIRAVETARIVLHNRNIPIIQDERLREMSFGDYEGVENAFQNSDCPMHIIYQEPAKYIKSIGGAETFAQLFARTGAFLEEIIAPQLQEGKDILIVGHGAMNASVICQIKGLPIEEFWSAGLEQCKLLKL